MFANKDIWPSTKTAPEQNSTRKLPPYPCNDVIDEVHVKYPHIFRRLEVRQHRRNRRPGHAYEGRRHKELRNFDSFRQPLPFFVRDITKYRKTPHGYPKEETSSPNKSCVESEKELVCDTKPSAALNDDHENGVASLPYTNDVKTSADICHHEIPLSVYIRKQKDNADFQRSIQIQQKTNQFTSSGKKEDAHMANKVAVSFNELNWNPVKGAMNGISESQLINSSPSNLMSDTNIPLANELHTKTATHLKLDDKCGDLREDLFEELRNTNASFLSVAAQAHASTIPHCHYPSQPSPGGIMLTPDTVITGIPNSPRTPATALNSVNNQRQRQEVNNVTVASEFTSGNIPIPVINSTTRAKRSLNQEWSESKKSCMRSVDKTVSHDTTSSLQYRNTNTKALTRNWEESSEAEKSLGKESHRSPYYDPSLIDGENPVCQPGQSPSFPAKNDFESTPRTFGPLHPVSNEPCPRSKPLGGIPWSPVHDTPTREIDALHPSRNDSKYVHHISHHQQLYSNHSSTPLEVVAHGQIHGVLPFDHHHALRGRRSPRHSSKLSTASFHEHAVFKTGSQEFNRLEALFKSESQPALSSKTSPVNKTGIEETLGDFTSNSNLNDCKWPFSSASNSQNLISPTCYEADGDIRRDTTSTVQLDFSNVQSGVQDKDASSQELDRIVRNFVIDAETPINAIAAQPAMATFGKSSGFRANPPVPIQYISRTGISVPGDKAGPLKADHNLGLSSSDREIAKISQKASKAVLLHNLKPRERPNSAVPRPTHSSEDDIDDTDPRRVDRANENSNFADPIRPRSKRRAYIIKRPRSAPLFGRLTPLPNEGNSDNDRFLLDYSSPEENTNCAERHVNESHSFKRDDRSGSNVRPTAVNGIKALLSLGEGSIDRREEIAVTHAETIMIPSPRVKTSSVNLHLGTECTSADSRIMENDGMMKRKDIYRSEVCNSQTEKEAADSLNMNPDLNFFSSSEVLSSTARNDTSAHFTNHILINKPKESSLDIYGETSGGQREVHHSEITMELPTKRDEKDGHNKCKNVFVDVFRVHNEGLGFDGCLFYSEEANALHADKACSDANDSQGSNENSLSPSTNAFKNCNTEIEMAEIPSADDSITRGHVELGPHGEVFIPNLHLSNITGDDSVSEVISSHLVQDKISSYSEGEKDNSETELQPTSPIHCPAVLNEENLYDETPEPDILPAQVVEVGWATERGDISGSECETPLYLNHSSLIAAMAHGQEISRPEESKSLLTTHKQSEDSEMEFEDANLISSVSNNQLRDDDVSRDNVPPLSSPSKVLNFSAESIPDREAKFQHSNITSDEFTDDTHEEDQDQSSDDVLRPSEEDEEESFPESDNNGPSSSYTTTPSPPGHPSIVSPSVSLSEELNRKLNKKGLKDPLPGDYIEAHSFGKLPKPKKKSPFKKLFSRKKGKYSPSADIDMINSVLPSFDDKKDVGRKKSSSPRLFRKKDKEKGLLDEKHTDEKPAKGRKKGTKPPRMTKDSIVVIRSSGQSLHEAMIDCLSDSDTAGQKEFFSKDNQNGRGEKNGELVMTPPESLSEQSSDETQKWKNIRQEITNAPEYVNLNPVTEAGDQESKQHEIKGEQLEDFDEEGKNSFLYVNSHDIKVNERMPEGEVVEKKWRNSTGNVGEDMEEEGVSEVEYTDQKSLSSDTFQQNSNNTENNSCFDSPKNSIRVLGKSSELSDEILSDHLDNIKCAEHQFVKTSQDKQYTALHINKTNSVDNTGDDQTFKNDSLPNNEPLKKISAENKLNNFEMLISSQSSPSITELTAKTENEGPRLSSIETTESDEELDETLLAAISEFPLNRPKYGKTPLLDENGDIIKRHSQPNLENMTDSSSNLQMSIETFTLTGTRDDVPLKRKYDRIERGDISLEEERLSVLDDTLNDSMEISEKTRADAATDATCNKIGEEIKSQITDQNQFPGLEKEGGDPSLKRSPSLVFVHAEVHTESGPDVQTPRQEDNVNIDECVVGGYENKKDSHGKINTQQAMKTNPYFSHATVFQKDDSLDLETLDDCSQDKSNAVNGINKDTKLLDSPCDSSKILTHQSHEDLCQRRISEYIDQDGGEFIPVETKQDVVHDASESTTLLLEAESQYKNSFCELININIAADELAKDIFTIDSTNDDGLCSHTLPVKEENISRNKPKIIPRSSLNLNGDKKIALHVANISASGKRGDGTSSQEQDEHTIKVRSEEFESTLNKDVFVNQESCVLQETDTAKSNVSMSVSTSDESDNTLAYESPIIPSVKRREQIQNRLLSTDPNISEEDSDVADAASRLTLESAVENCFLTSNASLANHGCGDRINRDMIRGALKDLDDFVNEDLSNDPIEAEVDVASGVCKLGGGQNGNSKSESYSDEKSDAREIEEELIVKVERAPVVHAIPNLDEAMNRVQAKEASISILKPIKFSGNTLDVDETENQSCLGISDRDNSSAGKSVDEDEKSVGIPFIHSASIEGNLVEDENILGISSAIPQENSDEEESFLRIPFRKADGDNDRSGSGVPSKQSTLSRESNKYEEMGEWDGERDLPDSPPSLPRSAFPPLPSASDVLSSSSISDKETSVNWSERDDRAVFEQGYEEVVDTIVAKEPAKDDKSYEEIDKREQENKIHPPSSFSPAPKKFVFPWKKKDKENEARSDKDKGKTREKGEKEKGEKKANVKIKDAKNNQDIKGKANTKAKSEEKAKPEKDKKFILSSNAADDRKLKLEKKRKTQSSGADSSPETYHEIEGVKVPIKKLPPKSVLDQMHDSSDSEYEPVNYSENKGTESEDRVEIRHKEKGRKLMSRMADSAGYEIPAKKNVPVSNTKKNVLLEKEKVMSKKKDKKAKKAGLQLAIPGSDGTVSEMKGNANQKNTISNDQESSDDNNDIIAPYLTFKYPRFIDNGAIYVDSPLPSSPDSGQSKAPSQRGNDTEDMIESKVKSKTRGIHFNKGNAPQPDITEVRQTENVDQFWSTGSLSPQLMKRNEVSLAEAFAEAFPILSNDLNKMHDMSDSDDRNSSPCPEPLILSPTESLENKDLWYQALSEGIGSPIDKKDYLPSRSVPSSYNDLGPGDQNKTCKDKNDNDSGDNDGNSSTKGLDTDGEKHTNAGQQETGNSQLNSEKNVKKKDKKTKNKDRKLNPVLFLKRFDRKKRALKEEGGGQAKMYPSTSDDTDNTNESDAISSESMPATDSNASDNDLQLSENPIEKIANKISSIEKDIASQYPGDDNFGEKVQVNEIDSGIHTESLGYSECVESQGANDKPEIQGPSESTKNQEASDNAEIRRTSKDAPVYAIVNKVTLSKSFSMDEVNDHQSQKFRSDKTVSMIETFSDTTELQSQILSENQDTGSVACHNCDISQNPDFFLVENEKPSDSYRLGHVSSSDQEEEGDPENCALNTERKSFNIEKDQWENTEQVPFSPDAADSVFQIPSCQNPSLTTDDPWKDYSPLELGKLTKSESCPGPPLPERSPTKSTPPPQSRPDPPFRTISTPPAIPIPKTRRTLLIHSHSDPQDDAVELRRDKNRKCSIEPSTSQITQDDLVIKPKTKRFSSSNEILDLSTIVNIPAKSKTTAKRQSYPPGPDSENVVAESKPGDSTENANREEKAYAEGDVYDHLPVRREWGDKSKEIYVPNTPLQPLVLPSFNLSSIEPSTSTVTYAAIRKPELVSRTTSLDKSSIYSMPWEDSDIENLTPKLPPRNPKKLASDDPEQKSESQAKRLSLSTLDLKPKVASVPGPYDLRNAISLAHGLDQDDTKGLSRHESAKDDKPQKVKKTISVRSLTSLFRRKKDKKTATKEEDQGETISQGIEMEPTSYGYKPGKDASKLKKDKSKKTEKPKKAEKPKKPLKLSKSAGSSRTIETIPSDIGLITGRPLCRLLRINEDETREVELRRHFNGKLGVGFSKGLIDGLEDGLFVNSFHDKGNEKFVAGILNIGDEILEIDKQDVRLMSLEQVKHLISFKEKINVKVMPVDVTRSVL